MSGKVRQLREEVFYDVPAPTLDEFLALDFPPREMVMAPILPVQGIAMVHAYRGIGKTNLSVGAALSVATGTPFLRWTVPQARPVYFIDGEMPGTLLQQRFAEAAKRLPADVRMPAPEYLRLFNPDIYDGPVPNLTTRAGQSAIEFHLEHVKLLVLDNISTLFRGGGRENDEESWVEAQEWLLSLRRQGVSTLLIHHDGKGGTQRGTSKREDVLDTVIGLKRPEDYQSEQGARFEVHFEKHRAFAGEDAKPFEAWLQSDVWTIGDVDGATEREVLELSQSGRSVRQIAGDLDIDKSKVHRILKRKGVSSGPGK